MGCNCGNKTSNNVQNQAKTNQTQTDPLMNFNLLITQNDRVNTLLESVSKMTDTILRSTSVMLLGVIDERIFVKNQLADGGQINNGQGYSTKAALIDIRDIRLTAGAKSALAQITGAKKGANQTHFFASYTQIRQAAGLQTDHVDLQFSNQMRNDFMIYPNITDNTYGLGLRTNESAEKMDNVERLYGKIFQLTQQEMLFLIDRIQQQINTLLR